jgi:hypothetical protein
MDVSFAYRSDEIAALLLATRDALMRSPEWRTVVAAVHDADIWRQR